jgi:DNA polymerase V
MCGAGHSKTLAKLATYYAKKQSQFNGVCDFTPMGDDELNAVLEKLPV